MNERVKLSIFVFKACKTYFLTKSDKKISLLQNLHFLTKSDKNKIFYFKIIDIILNNSKCKTCLIHNGTLRTFFQLSSFIRALLHKSESQKIAIDKYQLSDWKIRTAHQRLKWYRSESASLWIKGYIFSSLARLMRN